MHQPAPEDFKRRKPLVTVEWQREVDVFTRETETRVFVKMYFDARDSGLLAAMPERLWKLLCLLATYMDENGNCYPSQTTIARNLGIARVTANRWVQEFLRFEFQGQHVASLISLGQPRQYHGRWTHNVYRLYPITGLRIFDKEPRSGTPRPKRSSAVYQKRYTEPQGRYAEYPSTDTVNRYTNQNQGLNEIQHTGVSSLKETPAEAAELVAYFHQRAGRPQSQKPTLKEIAQARELIAMYGRAQGIQVVDFAIAAAAETHFAMRTFGAIRQYVPEAIEQLSRETAKRRGDLEAKRSEREEIVRREAQRQAFLKLSPAEKLETRLADYVAVKQARLKRELTPLEIQEMKKRLAQEMGFGLPQSA